MNDFKEIFKNARIGIIIIDHKGSIEDINNEALQIFGYKYDDLFGKSFKKLLCSKKSPNNLINILEKNMLYGEYIAIKNNESEFPIEISISKINDNKRFTLIIKDITLIKDREKELKHHAYFDHLTGLPNRNLFIDRSEVALSQAKRSNDFFSIIFIDLDGFKNINDTFGHDAGDHMLKVFSQNLLKCARESDTVARVGGDEFNVLMPRINSINDVIELSKRIIHTNKLPVKINNNNINLKSSIGISIYPEDGTSISKLIKSSDKAMYHAKRSGNNSFYHCSFKKI